MIYIIISITIFLGMALFPIVSSLIALRRRPSQELIIPTLLVDDPKYFTDLYRSAFKVKLEAMDDENVVEYSFKDSEKIVEADKTIEYPILCNNIIYAEHHDFIPPEGITFNKEIYANKNVYLVGTKSIIGIYCKKKLYLSSGIDVIRWIDAEGEITIEDNCSLGLITSSSTRIILGENCIFTKMLSPQIFLGFNKGTDFKSFSKSPVVEPMFSSYEIARDIKYVDDDIADEQGVYDKTIISSYDVSVVDGITVKGHIRSHKSVRVGSNAIVFGNIFAEESIYLSKGCKVLGNIFTQDAVYAEQNVTIGQKGKIKSVVAKEKIEFEKCCVVYGYIESEDICEVCVTSVSKETENED